MANLKFIQAQSFQLQASGASLGDTSITLQSFKYPDGVTNIVTADLGAQCYGTLEPNNGTQEEAIQFTGVTQNASGTATLTGVSSVGFNSPYTVTSGLAKSHAGAATFIISNDAAFYGNIKTYIDTVVASGAALADNLTAGITKLSVSPVTGSNPIAVGDNDTRVPTSSQSLYLSGIVPTSIPYAVATGTANAYTATLGSAVSSLASGAAFHFLVPATNATAVTINVNSLGAKTINKNVNTTLASADIVKGQIVAVAYDGTNFQLMSPPDLTGFYQKIGENTLASNATGMAVGPFPTHKDLKVIIHVTGRQSSAGVTSLQFNSDGANNYGYTYIGFSGANTFSYTTLTAAAVVALGGRTDANSEQMYVVDITNDPTLRKFINSHSSNNGSNGAGTTDVADPSYGTGVWNNTSNQITSLIVSSSGTLNSGTRVTVYGAN